MENIVKDTSTVKIPTPEIRDALPASIVDNGKIRMGSFSPMFPPAPAK
jgi:hypothetical protein